MSSLTASLYYHPHFAWNLLADAERSKLIEIRHPSYWSNWLARGTRDGWLNADNSRRAREMLVFADKVLLPDFIDLPLSRDLEAHVSYGWREDRDLYLGKPITTSALLQEIQESKPFLLEALRIAGYAIRARDFDRFVQLWRTAEEKEANFYTATLERVKWGGTDVKTLAASLQRALGILTPREQRPELEPMRALLASEFRYLREAGVMAEKGIFSLGHSPKRIRMRKSTEREDAAPAVVGVYFENSICCPSPETIGDALKLRENPSIVRWRHQMRAWQEAFALGTIELKDVEEEVKKANDYVRTAKCLSRMVPAWSVLVTLALPVAAHFVPQLSGAEHSVSLTLSILKAYGWLVDTAVSSPERMEYKWLMIANG